MIIGGSKIDQSTIRQLSPDEPWRWDPEWASGVISANSVRSVMVQWFFVIFWNAVSSVVFVRYVDEWQAGDRTNLILLVFPLIGLILLYVALRDTMQLSKYGRSWLHLQTIPGVIGGKMKGQVVLSAAFVNSNDFILRLQGMQVLNNGKNSEIKIVWQDEQEISPSTFSTTFMKTVPFEFAIPHNLPPTDEGKMVLWKLFAATNAPGINYAVDFDVPVFITKDSNPNFLSSVQEEVTVPAPKGINRKYERARRFLKGLGAKT